MSKELNLDSFKAEFIDKLDKINISLGNKDYYDFLEFPQDNGELIVDSSDLGYEWLYTIQRALFYRLKYVWYEENREEIDNRLIDKIAMYLGAELSVIGDSLAKDFSLKVLSDKNFCLELLNKLKDITVKDRVYYSDTDNEEAKEIVLDSLDEGTKKEFNEVVEKTERLLDLIKYINMAKFGGSLNEDDILGAYTSLEFTEKYNLKREESLGEDYLLALSFSMANLSFLDLTLDTTISEIIAIIRQYKEGEIE